MADAALMAKVDREITQGGLKSQAHGWSAPGRTWTSTTDVSRTLLCGLWVTHPTTLAGIRDIA